MNDHPRPGDSVAFLSRRSLLKGLGLAVAASALPLIPDALADAVPAPPPAPPPTPAPSVLPELCRYMAAASGRDLPAEVTEKAKHHILDTLAAMISGANLAPAKAALRFADATKAGGTITVVGSSFLCGPLEAALVNGVLAQSDETDDSHAPSHSHPGCAIVASALASAEYFHGDGRRLLRSVVLGYDVGTRTTMALGGLPFQMQSHRSTHSICANFGAASAAACVAGLSEAQMRWIVDFAAQQSGGSAAWQRDTEHTSKALVFGGFPARNGVTAAMLVQLGATGVNDILSGADNFFAANSAKARPEKLVAGLGEIFEVTRTNIKKWTVGSPIQAPLDAIDAIRRRRPFGAADVKAVVVRVATSEAKTVNNREMPDISLQHLVAVMLVDGTVSFLAAHDRERMADPAILAARAKVTLIGDEELERRYPVRESVVTITFQDGSMETERVSAVRGTAENPMTRDEVVAKCRDLIAPFLGADKTERLIATIFDLEKVADIRDLRPLLQKT